jgi:hypothetical protein
VIIDDAATVRSLAGWMRARGKEHREGIWFRDADVAVALSLSLTHKAVGFDRAIPTIDVDTLDHEPTGTLPVGVPGASRYDGARNRQQPRGSPSAPGPHASDSQ